MKSVLPRPCRCCGYLTFPEALGTGGICKVCGWIELSPDERHRSRVSIPDLAKATDCFQRSGASDPGFQSSVRPPRPEEIPPDGWELFHDQLRREIQTVLSAIDAAFAGVELGGNGIGLEVSRIIDDYWDRTPPPEYLETMEINHARHWRDVLPSLLMHYREFFSFTNFEGFRYFAPAYATASLQSLLTGGQFEADLLLYALCRPRCDLFQHLNPAQKHALTAFLACFVRFSDNEHHVETATEALAGYWGRYPNSALVWD